MILLDTSGLLAWIDGDQRQHAAVVSAMTAAKPPYLLSPFVLAELDYLLSTRVGRESELALLAEVERGGFQLEHLSAADVGAASHVLERYHDLDVGLADASLVVLAERHQAWDVLTLDERHFRTLRGARGKRFRLWPSDRP
jgi:predicted nucleic acid-binding protein